MSYLVQSAFGVLASSVDPTNPISKPLPSYNPKVSELPANPFAVDEPIIPIFPEDPAADQTAQNVAQDSQTGEPAPSTDSTATDAPAVSEGPSDGAPATDAPATDAPATDADATKGADADADATKDAGKTTKASK